jgi:hypothetical protein
VAQQRAAQGAMSEAGGMRHDVQERLQKTLEAKLHIEAKLRSVLKVRLSVLACFISGE